MAWLLPVCQVPDVAGEIAGLEVPRTWVTGFEKVRVIGVLALNAVPGAGVVTAAAAEPAGNQLTGAADALSQLRGAPATHTDPASLLRGSVTVLWGLPS